MLARNLVAACALAVSASSALALDVLVLSSDLPSIDSLVVSTLTSLGHNVTLGQSYYTFDGSATLNVYDVVYIQANYNWSSGDMPLTGQTALNNWISAGGGLVTGEWFMWKVVTGLAFSQLAPAMPSTTSGSYSGTATADLSALTTDPVMNLNLPAQFTLPYSFYGGTETLLEAASFGTMFFSTSTWAGAGAVIGGSHGAGRIVNISNVMGEDTLNDPNGAQLLSNAINWAGRATISTCYADCDTSTGVGALDIFDFLCFQNKFVNGSPYACDCDQSTGLNVCDIFDFLCFQNAFAAGCP